jgi:crotonobetainyl-CoA:carnitine CoA-transferase CaiB-like acyl-CoA transferase
VAVVNSIEQVVADPQIRHRGMVTELCAPDGRHARVMGNPIAMAGAPGAEPRFPPRLGEDTHEVLREVLGLSTAEVDDLLSGGVVASPHAAGSAAKRTK